MNNNEKLEVLQNHIDVIMPHIIALEKDIDINPYGDIDGKPLRSDILSDFMRQKESLESIYLTLNNEHNTQYDIIE